MANHTPKTDNTLAPFALPGDGGTIVVGHPVDPEGEGLRQAAGRFPTGVAVLTIHDDEGDGGMTLNSFTSVSLVPPLVTVCVSRKASMYRRLHVGMTAGLSILSGGQENIARQFASVVPDRFAGIAATRHARENVQLIDGASSWIVGTIEHLVPAGDHDVVVIKVVSTAVSDAQPLVFKAGQMMPWPLGG